MIMDHLSNVLSFHWQKKISINLKSWISISSRISFIYAMVVKPMRRLKVTKRVVWVKVIVNSFLLWEFLVITTRKIGSFMARPIWRSMIIWPLCSTRHRLWTSRMHRLWSHWFKWRFPLHVSKTYCISAINIFTVTLLLSFLWLNINRCNLSKCLCVVGIFALYNGGR